MECNPNELTKKIRGFSNGDLSDLAISGQHNTMATLRRNLGVEKVLSMISIHLIYCDEVMNLNRRLTQPMVDAIAEDLYDVAYFLSFEELTRFFKEFRQGIHGKTFQGLNSENVCNAAISYIQSRALRIAQKNENESNSWKVRREREEMEQQFGRGESVAELMEKMKIREEIENGRNGQT